MSRIFLIDSENVGDSWTLLLDATDMSDELYVFYTQKSPHMSYKNLIRVKTSPKDVQFIECFEGNNALDFQLVTELGYRLALDNGENEFFIVSNDNGFEAVVRYWRRKGKPVRRFTGKACASLSSLIKEASETTPAASPAVDSEPVTTNTQPIPEVTTEVSEEIPEAADIVSEESEPANENSENTDVPSSQEINTEAASEEVANDVPVVIENVTVPEQITVAEEAKEEPENKKVPSKKKEQVSKKKNRKSPKTTEPNKAAETDEVLTTSPVAVPADETEPANAAETSESAAADEAPAAEPAAVDAPEGNMIDAAIENANAELESITVDELSLQAFYIIGKDNLANLHEALMQLYGNDKCKKLYNIFKTDASYNKIPTEYKNMSPLEKQNAYCKVAFLVQGSTLSVPEDFAEVILKSWRGKKNLNSLRARLMNKYTKEIGLQYYTLIKAHMKVLDNIS